MKLKDKVAIVTGASAKASARRLQRRYIQEGANVAIADLNLAEAKSDGGKAHGNRPRPGDGESR